MLTLSHNEKKQANFFFKRVILEEEHMLGELLVWESLGQSNDPTDQPFDEEQENI